MKDEGKQQKKQQLQGEEEEELKRGRYDVAAKRKLKKAQKRLGQTKDRARLNAGTTGAHIKIVTFLKGRCCFQRGDHAKHSRSEAGSFRNLVRHSESS